MPSNPIHEAAARGFERGVADYERGRPGYPREAIDFLAETLRLEPGGRVLDLAAGSGKFTRELRGSDVDIVAVEPVAAMRDALAEALPEIEVAEGTAEEIPLADGSVDAVVAAQAFHWFDGERALAEIHRVLKPGGRLALVWNRRDQSSELQERLSELIEPYRGDVPSYGSKAWRAPFEGTALFTPLAERHFAHAHVTDREGLASRIASISFISALPDPQRGRVLDAVRALAGDGETVALLYRTDVYWCERV
jgi:SAM-dependent methyltransferase